MSSLPFPKLKFPDFQAAIEKEGDKFWILDIIRRKKIVLTPEEWVRQHVIHYLIHQKKIPKGLIKVEAAHKYGHGTKRSDILIADRQGAIWMIIECKAPMINLSEKTLLQAAHYAGSSNSKFLMLTNGNDVFLASLDPSPQHISHWPDYNSG